MVPPVSDSPQSKSIQEIPSAIFGVIAAAVTPLSPDYKPDLAGLPQFLAFLARRGCHGALLLGTTGEGPSFSPQQRLDLIRAALEVRQDHPQFRLLAGTGTPSLAESIDLTAQAFAAGVDGVVVLPPYYFRSAGEQGLFEWFSRLIMEGVPAGQSLFAYHIPAVSGVPLSLDLLARLKETFPDRFAGIKDSSGDAAHAQALGARFGGEMIVLTGNDRLLSLALQNQAVGCITAAANLISPGLRRLWEAFQSGQSVAELQDEVSQQRAILERYPPLPALIKALLARQFGFPSWTVCPPLLSVPAEIVEQVSEQLQLA